jgi:hypothetical protein
MTYSMTSREWRLWLHGFLENRDASIAKLRETSERHETHGGDERSNYPTRHSTHHFTSDQYPPGGTLGR